MKSVNNKKLRKEQVSENLELPEGLDIAKILNKIHILINTKNIWTLFLGLTILHITITILYLFKIKFSNLLYHLISFSISTAIIFVCAFSLVIVKKYVLPKIQKTKENIRSGNIWYLEWVSLDPLSPGSILCIKISNGIYNFFMISLGIMGVFAMIYSFVGMAIVISSLISSIILNIEPELFIINMSVWLVSINVFYFSWISLYKSYVNKKYTLLFLLKNFDKTENSNSKLLFFQNILLKYLKSYSIQKDPKSLPALSQKTIRSIIGYYAKILLVLLPFDKVMIKYFYKFKENLEDDNYNGLLEHLSYLSQNIKKLPQYKEHLQTLSSYDPKIKNMNELEFGYKLSKGSIFSLNTSNILNQMWHFFENTTIGKYCRIILLISIFLIFFKLGFFDTILEKLGISAAELLKMIFY